MNAKIYAIYWRCGLLNDTSICGNKGIFVNSQAAHLISAQRNHFGNELTDEHVKLGSAHSISNANIVAFENSIQKHFLSVGTCHSGSRTISS